MKLAETIYQILAEETYAEEYKSPIHREQVRTRMRVIADKIANQLEPLVMPKPTHWLKLKLTEMLVELENRVDRHNSSSWIVNNDALQEYKDGIIYIKKLLSA